MTTIEPPETESERVARIAVKKAARRARMVDVYTSLTAVDRHGRTIDEKIAVQDDKLAFLRGEGVAEANDSIQAIVRFRAELVVRKAQIGP